VAAAGVPPFPTVPAASTYVNGPLRAGELRGDVANGVLFLANRPVFTGQCTSGPSITGTAVVPLDTGVYDNWLGHSPLSANPERYWCQVPGWYVAEGYIPWSYTGPVTQAFTTSLVTGVVGGPFTLNGQQHWTNSGVNPGTFGADLFQCTRTGAIGALGVDYIEMQAGTTGTSIPLLASASGTGTSPAVSPNPAGAMRGNSEVPRAHQRQGSCARFRRSGK
jgi:hypothetical protein